MYKLIEHNLKNGIKYILNLPVGYGLRASPGCHVSGAHTAFEALILWAYFMRSSEDTGCLLALLIDCNFCFA